VKKLILCLLVSTLLTSFSLFAQPSKYVKLGGNYSYLKEPSYGEPGGSYLYGIGKDWQLYRWIQLRTELLISHSSTLLKDRSVHTLDPYESFPYLPNEPRTISYFDIDIHLRYLEIPLLLRVERSLRKSLSIGLEIGYSLKFPLKDASQNTVLRRIKSIDLTDEQRQNFRFDYRGTNNNENYSYHGRGLCPNFGMYVNYTKFQIGLRYQVDYVDWVSSIVIGEDVPLRFFSLSMGYRF
jgi:hypothetical protein